MEQDKEFVEDEELEVSKAFVELELVVVVEAKLLDKVLELVVELVALVALVQEELVVMGVGLVVGKEFVLGTGFALGMVFDLAKALALGVVLALKVE